MRVQQHRTPVHTPTLLSGAHHTSTATGPPKSESSPPKPCQARLTHASTAPCSARRSADRVCSSVYIGELSELNLSSVIFGTRNSVNRGTRHTRSKVKGGWLGGRRRVDGSSVDGAPACKIGCSDRARWRSNAASSSAPSPQPLHARKRAGGRCANRWRDSCPHVAAEHVRGTKLRQTCLRPYVRSRPRVRAWPVGAEIRPLGPAACERRATSPALAPTLPRHGPHGPAEVPCRPGSEPRAGPPPARARRSRALRGYYFE